MAACQTNLISLICVYSMKSPTSRATLTRVGCAALELLLVLDEQVSPEWREVGVDEVEVGEKGRLEDMEGRGGLGGMSERVQLPSHSLSCFSSVITSFK